MVLAKRLEMRPVIQSLFVHATLALLAFGLFWFQRRLAPVLESGVELIQVERTTSPSGSNQKPPPRVKRPVQPLPSSANQPTNPAASSAATATNATSTNSAAPGNGPTYDESEVAILPKLKSEIRIPYPLGPKNRGVQGPVVFNLIVDSDGSVRSLEMESAPDPELAEAAATAVKQFRFVPARFQDKPVAIKIRYTYRFILK